MSTSAAEVAVLSVSESGGSAGGESAVQVIFPEVLGSDSMIMMLSSDDMAADG